MQKHFLNYLTEVMSHQWNDAALTDYGENHEYTFSELATEMLRMHILFEKLGLKKGSKIAIAGRNCANWAVSYLSIASYEAVCVSILQDFHPKDIAHLLEHSDSEMLFVGPYVWHEIEKWANESKKADGEKAALPKNIKVALSLEDFRPLYVSPDVVMPSEKEISAAFNTKFPHGI